MSPLRILVTASRNIRDTPANRQWMGDALLRDGLSMSTVGTPVLVHGAQVAKDPDTDGWMGGDWLAEQVWLELAAHVPGGLDVERHPADWDRYGRAAGPRRNAEMVGLGAHACVAFPLGASRGTRGCMKLAAEAGIPVFVHEIAVVP
jgi:hypothetical protein